MFAVEALSGYISRGVNTVSGPFHPFGGAVDIVVVEQQDGSYKSSPWYVRFGKFQGVLKAKEKVVNISVDGVEANFHMYLDHTGVAYFLREVDADEMTSMLWHSSANLQTDEECSERMSLKSKSCNYNAGQLTKTDVSTGKVVARTRSDGSQVLGIVFESQSMKEVKLSDNECKDNANSSLDGEEKKDLQIKDNIVNNSDNSGLEEICNSSESSFEKPGRSVEVTRVEISCSTNETSPLCKSGFEENISNDELNSETSRKIDEIGATNVDHNDTIKGVKSEKNGPFVTSETSRIGNCEVSMNAETLAETTTQQISEVNSRPEMEAKESFNSHGSLGDKNCFNSFSDPKICESENSSSNTKSVVTETHSEKVTVHPVNGSAKEFDSCSVLTISASKSISVAQDDLKAGDSQEVKPREVSITEEIEISRPNSPEEEQFLFSDLDDFKPREVKQVESISLDHSEQENPYSLLSSAVESADESFSSNIEADSPQNNDEESRQEVRSVSSHIDIPESSKVLAQEVRCMAESLPTVLSDFDDLDAQDVQSILTHSLDSNSKPSKWLLIRKDVARCIKSARDEEHGSSSKSKSNTEDDKISEELENVNAGPPVGDPSKISTASSGSWRLWPFSLSRSKKVTEPLPEKVAEPDPKKVTEPNPNKVTEPDPKNVNESGPTCMTDNNAENSLESTSGTDPEKDTCNEKVRKLKVRANSPTSEQLLSLNLKEGRNTVTFTFLTSMLGEQQVDARIYLWRWDARIVISDVDGTITKSDILGQFMPLVGKDWSHTGVAHLFSAIKENGYQMLFLSARAISQAYLTRQFLFNLKQDGVALPDGPVVISPDGLFPSLFREVIRRAPHEFKIACLEDIKALFPSDRNPFYAGFGNRDTDEISYLKVGIPKGKIFIVNPKGEVVVNRSVDTKSYTSLKALVNRMFPPPSSLEPEDFNNWNFWKLPPPAINI